MLLCLPRCVLPTGFLVAGFVNLALQVNATGNSTEKADYFTTSTIEDDSTSREVPIVTKIGALGVLGSHPIRAFAAPGTQFGGVIRRLDTSGRIVATIVITGCYIPVP